MKTLDRLREDWLLSTEINKLESRLWRQVNRDDLKTILVTSAVRGEGKSTTVAYLATALGMYPNRRILAIDFDFRVPSLNHHFDLKIKKGIDQALLGECSVLDTLIPTALPSLHVAVPSLGGADPDLLLRTQELVDLMAVLKDAYDLILLDAPAIIPVPDTTMVMPLADGVIITGMAGKTTKNQLMRAQEICEGLGARVLGLVVGNLREAAPEYVADEYNYSGYHESARARARAKSGTKGHPEAGAGESEK